MPEDMITIRLRRDHAAFLDENLTRMAEHTRDAMKSPCLPRERRNALYSRAILLEYVDDAIRAALAEVAAADALARHDEDDYVRTIIRPERSARCLASQA